MKPEYHSTTIQKALNVLQLFVEHKKLSFTEMQKMLGFNKSTLFRIVATLTFNEFLKKDKAGMYELGLAIFTLGHRTSVKEQLKSVAVPIMVRLSEDLNMTAHLGILNGLEVVIIAKVSPERSIQMASRVGGAVPAHCTGQGKTLLAYTTEEVVIKIANAKGLTRFTPTTITTLDGLIAELRRIRERGFTYDDSEHEKDLRCVAVPILDEAGQLVAALSVTGLTTDLSDDEAIQKTATLLRDYRDKIAKEMKYL